MKRIIILVLLFIFAITDYLYGQKLFYQYKNILIEDDNEVKIRFRGNEYGIYCGVVSSKGNYISGYLFEGDLKERMESRRKAAAIVSYSKIADVIFVIYSCKDSNIFYVDTLGYATQCIFSENEKYVLLSIDYWNFEISKLFNLEKNKIEYEFPEYYEDFKWVEDELYFFSEGNLEYTLCHYDRESQQIEEIYSIYKEKTYKKCDDYYFEIIDTSRVLFKCETEEGSWLRLVDNKKISTLVGFENLCVEYISENKILFKVRRAYDGYDFYSLNLEDNNVERLFTFKDMTNTFPKSLIFGYNFLFQIKNDIYFLTTIGGPSEFNNIIKYNIKTQTFSMFKKGEYTTPIGYFEE